VSPQLALSLVQMPCQHSMDDAAFERLLREVAAALEVA
jgi:hypothetical protein